MNFNLDVTKVVGAMLQASAAALAKGGQKATEYATHEYAAFISDIEHVQTMAEEGTISKAEAQALVDQHKLSMQAVLVAIEGLGLIAVQEAINAALRALNDALKDTLGSAFKALKFGL
jgi:hypothetical protein